ncbi:MAG: transglycosylase SLT domain-containing protein, partial [Actinomycetota bacterium]|nr:transglycosylase SLT domain-containing protein [Actinomycetota bacterium]
SLAYRMMPSFGFDPATQFSCLNNIWTRESGWRYNAANASGAYGIPQALPGSKMASAGADWLTNPATQIKWGLGYIQSVYGTPCNAWVFWQGHGWY